MAANRDPYAGFNFLVDIKGGGGREFQASFAEVGGLKGEVEEFEIKEGGLNNYTHRRPGRTIWGPITLKKGLSNEHEFMDWWSEVAAAEGAAATRTVTISLLNRKDETVRVWELKDAWPKSWEGAVLNAASSDLAIESLVLNHHGITQRDS
jgi:phage tail-like protein